MIDVIFDIEVDRRNFSDKSQGSVIFGGRAMKILDIGIIARYFFKKNKTKLLQSKSKCPRIVRVVIK